VSPTFKKALGRPFLHSNIQPTPIQRPSSPELRPLPTSAFLHPQTKYAADKAPPNRVWPGTSSAADRALLSLPTSIHPVRPAIQSPSLAASAGVGQAPLPGAKPDRSGGSKVAALNLGEVLQLNGDVRAPTTRPHPSTISLPVKESKSSRPVPLSAAPLVSSFEGMNTHGSWQHPGSSFQAHEPTYHEPQSYDPQAQHTAWPATNFQRLDTFDVLRGLECRSSGSRESRWESEVGGGRKLPSGWRDCTVEWGK
jgi:hypothetical protein